MKLIDITVTRLVAAPAEEVFDLWIDPKRPGGPWFGAERTILRSSRVRSDRSDSAPLGRPGRRDGAPAQGRLGVGAVDARRGLGFTGPGAGGRGPGAGEGD